MTLLLYTKLYLSLFLDALLTSVFLSIWLPYILSLTQLLLSIRSPFTLSYTSRLDQTLVCQISLPIFHPSVPNTVIPRARRASYSPPTHQHTQTYHVAGSSLLTLSSSVAFTEQSFLGVQLHFQAPWHAPMKLHLYFPQARFPRKALICFFVSSRKPPETVCVLVNVYPQCLEPSRCPINIFKWMSQLVLLNVVKCPKKGKHIVPFNNSEPFQPKAWAKW